jgi:hypothetical protein
MIFFAALNSVGQAADDCTDANGDISWVEWTEGSKLRGARLVFDNQWQEARTMHGLFLAYESLSLDAPVSGWLRLGLPPFMDRAQTDKLKADLGIREASRIDTALDPRMIEFAIRATSGDFGQRDVFSVTQPRPASVAGKVGLSRGVGGHFHGRVLYGTAVAVDDGCFFMFGIFAAKNGRELSIEEDLRFLNSTLRVEMYEPAPRAKSTPTSPPAPPKDWSFESFRRALGLDQANGRQ